MKIILFLFFAKGVIIVTYDKKLKNNWRDQLVKGHMNTKNGEILIDNEVISKYAGLAAVECFGIVGMAAVSVKDGLVKLLMRNNVSQGVNVTVENNKLIIDFHITVAYGISIMTVSENLMDSVKYKVEEFTGMEVEKINIFVEGVRTLD